MKEITRRNFVKNSLLTGTMLTVPFAKVRGANDDIRVAVAGINGRGRGLIGNFNDIPGVRVVALCDVDRNVLEREVKKNSLKRIKFSPETEITPKQVETKP